MPMHMVISTVVNVCEVKHFAKFANEGPTCKNFLYFQVSRALPTFS